LAGKTSHTSHKYPLGHSHCAPPLHCTTHPNPASLLSLSSYHRKSGEASPRSIVLLLSDGRRPGRSCCLAGGGRGRAICFAAAVVARGEWDRRRVGVAPAAEGRHRPRPRHRGRIRRDVRGRVRGRGIGTYGTLECVMLICAKKIKYSVLDSTVMPF
jgi:hypothetical protein